MNWLDEPDEAILQNSFVTQRDDWIDAERGKALKVPVLRRIVRTAVVRREGFVRVADESPAIRNFRGSRSRAAPLLRGFADGLTKSSTSNKEIPRSAAHTLLSKNCYEGITHLTTTWYVGREGSCQWKFLTNMIS